VRSLDSAICRGQKSESRILVIPRRAVIFRTLVGVRVCTYSMKPVPPGASPSKRP
jgi:hypothetical protein